MSQTHEEVDDQWAEAFLNRRLAREAAGWAYEHKPRATCPSCKRMAPLFIKEGRRLCGRCASDEVERGDR